MKSGAFLIAAMIVLSYLPVDSCHAGSQVKTDCGQLFHCPVLFGGGFLESLELPHVRTLRSFKWVKTAEGFESPVFRPPEKAVKGTKRSFFYPWLCRALNTGLFRAKYGLSPIYTEGLVSYIEV